MKPIHRIAAAAMLSATAVWPARAEETVDLDAINKIVEEGTRQSEVVDTLQHMSDVIGGRLTASPAHRQATQWAMERFTEWGLKNAHLEGFDFGRGWDFSKSVVRMTEPRVKQLHALPVGWSPGTDGVVTGEAILATMSDEKDFDKYRGKLAGKIVLVSKPRDIGRAPSNNIFVRLDDNQLKNIADFKTPDYADPDQLKFFAKALTFAGKLSKFLADEGAAAAVRISPRDAALIEASSYLHGRDNTLKVPVVSMTAEDYDLIARLLNDDKSVQLELEVETHFYDEDPKGYSVFAEIPGRGRNPEIVMAGGHFDSWFVGDGSVDDGAGSAVVMEAARILSALNFKPRRTIRFALWGGEEQGLYGSIQYVKDHVADRPMPENRTYPDLPDFFEYNQGFPITPKGEHSRISAYFNLDNGSGKIRGIYGEGNFALQPIFKAWFRPFNNMGAKTITLDSTGGTDHLPFTWAGIPAFQFIQDPLNYGSQMHHSQIDVMDYVQPEDLRQASIIMASFLYNAAMREDMLPRLPIPTEPKNWREAREKKAAEGEDEEVDENSESNE